MHGAKITVRRHKVKGTRYKRENPKNKIQGTRKKSKTQGSGRKLHRTKIASLSGSNFL
jgi:hypothetical protein